MMMNSVIMLLRSKRVTLLKRSADSTRNWRF